MKHLSFGTIVIVAMLFGGATLAQSNPRGLPRQPLGDVA
jgi:hypothetical protein